MFAMANISDWLVDELNKREWSQAELARKANISRAAVSDLISGRRKLGKDTALSIASAFEVSLDAVLRGSGDLPDISNASSVVDEIAYKSKQLDEAEQFEILEFVKMKLRLAKTRGIKSGKTAKSTK